MADREGSQVARQPVPGALKAAGAAHVLLGVGFGLGAAWTINHLGRTGELPMTPFGFRSLAGGPFEALPVGQFTALGWALVGTCALDVVAGLWLWQGRRRGAVLGLITDLPAFVLSIGFALPFLLVGVPLRAALMAIGRRGLR